MRYSRQTRVPRAGTAQSDREITIHTQQLDTVNHTHNHVFVRGGDRKIGIRMGQIHSGYEEAPTPHKN